MHDRTFEGAVRRWGEEWESRKVINAVRLEGEDELGEVALEDLGLGGARRQGDLDRAVERRDRHDLSAGSH